MVSRLSEGRLRARRGRVAPARRSSELPDVSRDARTQPTVMSDATARNVEMGHDLPPAAATSVVAIIGVRPPITLASW